MSKNSGRHSMKTRVSETCEDYHINLDKSSGHRHSQCRKQIKALIFVDLQHTMSSNSNGSALSAHARITSPTTEILSLIMFICKPPQKTQQVNRNLCSAVSRQIDKKAKNISESLVTCLFWEYTHDKWEVLQIKSKTKALIKSPVT